MGWKEQMKGRKGGAPAWLGQGLGPPEKHVAGDNFPCLPRVFTLTASAEGTVCMVCLQLYIALLSHYRYRHVIPLFGSRSLLLCAMVYLYLMSDIHTSTIRVEVFAFPPS